MAIVFPASPSVNDTFTEGSITYKWDGAKWIGLGVTPADRLVEGSNKLEIDGSNNLVWTGDNVGIGTDNPGEKLVVQGPVVCKGTLSAGQTSAGVLDFSGNDLRIRCYGATTGSGAFSIRTGGGAGNADTEALRITSDGRLITKEDISIEGTGDKTLSIYCEDTGVQATPKTFINLYGENTANEKKLQAQIASAPGAVASSAGELHFSTNNSSSVITRRMTINQDGNVGVGLVAPRVPLEINATHDTTAGNLTPVLRLSTGNSYTGLNTGSALEFGTTNTLYPTWVKGRIGAVYDNVTSFGGEIVFHTNNGSSQTDLSEKMRITAGGEIGTQLKITMRENLTDAFSLDSNGANGYFRIVDEYDTFERLRIHGDGTFSLNTTGASNYDQTDNTRNLDTTSSSVGGNFAFRRDKGTMIIANDANTGWSLMYINKFNWVSGDDNRWAAFYLNGSPKDTIIWNGSNVIFGGASDYRIKKNVRDFTSGIDKVKQLKVHIFDYIETDRGNNHVGFIAHELQEVIPEAVGGVKDGMRKDEQTGEDVMDVQMVEAGKVTPVLTAALQEAIAEIETLKARLDAAGL
ncbi:tail fiber protein [Synechococcus phage ACG-2014e]|uniref:Peptidase S74 domain-containing protein n=1 Tax=Synechococcus phage ACG-2014e TaxID=1493510 RepID=A0A0E3HAZ2_9CAUD|nr:tail fiber protein [Synechococcus phage ACG-2014e]YP_010355792.1 tail fiber protein [Synechococcus phage ACG-2014e]AIX20643.1 hypothetical protein Syn7803C85_180 [Synechococcus phage ACG-2014e]AIX29858.1 hypothetical protein Syn7803US33_177 [Synechococcus phage ACG-2014e]AIX45096.1 hypothetical protein Syn7803C2_177 [Synechococcus phage ACG-2014e]